MQNWSKGVDIELHGAGSYRTVKSTEEAAQCLISHWPRGKGEAHQHAQRACLNALEGALPPELAREAFIAAALAAKIHIRLTEDPRTNATGAAKNSIPIADSPAFRKANHDAKKAIKESVGRLKSERGRFFKEHNSG